MGKESSTFVLPVLPGFDKLVLIRVTKKPRSLPILFLRAPCLYDDTPKFSSISRIPSAIANLPAAWALTRQVFCRIRALGIEGVEVVGLIGVL